MNTITLTKPDGTKFQVNDRRNQSKQMNNFQVNGPTGYIGNSSVEEEPLYPIGFTLQDNGQIETPIERSKRETTNTGKAKSKPSEDDDMLLPLGVELED